jgi:Fe-S-cluster containining protein
LKRHESVPGHEPGEKFCVDKSPDDGLCVYYDRETHGCGIWEERPSLCREYDCNRDPLLQVVLRDGFHSLLALVSAPRPDTCHTVPHIEIRDVDADVIALRERLDDLVAPEDLSAAERREAERLSELRTRIADAIGSPRACRECARDLPEPEGKWPGGRCCGRPAEQLFCAEELIPLRAAGARAEDYATRTVVGGGCPFRSPRGCGLAPRLRPDPCLHYVCEELETELRERGDYEWIQAMLDELESAAHRFQATHAVASLARELDGAL